MAACLLLGIGCGSGSDPEAPSGRSVAEARSTVAALYGAIGRGDAPQVCAMLTPEARRRAVAVDLTGRAKGCEAALSGFLEGARRGGTLPADEGVDVRGVVVSGEAATVTALVGGAAVELPLVREGDRWQVASLGVPAP